MKSFDDYVKYSFKENDISYNVTLDYRNNMIKCTLHKSSICWLIIAIVVWIMYWFLFFIMTPDLYIKAYFQILMMKFCNIFIPKPR